MAKMPCSQFYPTVDASLICIPAKAWLNLTILPIRLQRKCKFAAATLEIMGLSCLWTNKCKWGDKTIKSSLGLMQLSFVSPNFNYNLLGWQSKRTKIFFLFFGGGGGVERLCRTRIIYLIEEICLNNNNIINVRN